MHLPDGEQASIYDVAMRYKKEGTPLVILAGTRVRHRLLARLGRQGHDAARGQGGHRGELRAHPSLEPDRHGRRPAAIPAAARAPSRSGSPGARSSRSRDCGAAMPGKSPSRRPRIRVSRSSSRHACASTRPRSASTTATAASCSTCCGSWPRQAARPDGLRSAGGAARPRVRAHARPARGRV